MAGIASINADGWSGEWSGGVPPTFAPDTSPVLLSAVRSGFDQTGAVASYAENFVVTKRVRQAYPNQASPSATTCSLSDYVYSSATDTIAGVTNNSTEISPLPIAEWLQPDRVVVGNSIAIELFAVHRNARALKPVACVIVTATDGTTTVSQTIANPTISASSGDACPVLVYACNLDISTLADNATITVNAKVYPWIGGAASVLDSSTGTADNPGFVPQKFFKRTARAAAPFYCYVDATSGSDSTGVASTNAATAAASPVATIGGAWVKLRAAIGSADVDGCVVRLKTGTHVFGSGNVFNTYQANARNIIERDPASANRAAVTLQFGAANLGYDNIKYLLWRDLTVSRQGNFSINSDIALSGYIALQDVTLDCAANAFKLTNSRLYMLGGVTLVNAAGTNAFSAQGTQAISLFRGVTGGATSAILPIEGFAIFGCNLTNAVLNWLTTRMSGSMICFNKFMKTSSELLGAGGAAIVGMAIAQNVMEWTSATPNAMGGPSRDSFVGNVTHLVDWMNTHAGANNAGRWNILYDDGPNGNLRTHKLQSVVGPIFTQLNIKNDVFAGNAGLADASSHTGNWAMAHGVGCRGIVTQFIDANGGGAPTFHQDYPGLNASIGTSSTARNDPKFVSYQAVTYNGSSYTAGVGAGDYRLDGTNSPAVGRIGALGANAGVLPFDLAGNARRTDAQAAAGAYETSFSPPISGTGSAGLGGLGEVGGGVVPIQGGGSGTLGGIGESGGGGLTPIAGAGAGQLGAITGSGTGEITDPPITAKGPIIAAAERIVALTATPDLTNLSTSLPAAAFPWDAPFDPSDRVPYALDFTELLGEAETIASIDKITMSAAGASLGIAVDTSSGRSPIISNDGKLVQVWLICATAFQQNAAFAGAGVKVGVSVLVSTSSTPFKQFERTASVTARQQ